MIVKIIIVLLLVVSAGLYAGLTLAVFGLGLTELETKVRLGDAQAKKVYPLRKKGNLLLCSLLLGNVLSYTVMTLYLDSLTSSVIAGLIATSLIFAFGEILPQAVFPRFALYISAKLSRLMRGSVILFYPVGAPIARILDRMLGKELPTLYNKEELGEIIKYHEDSENDIIDEDEERIMLGALTFSDKTAREIMIAKEEVFYLAPETIVDDKLLAFIKEEGFRHIPVYDDQSKKFYGVVRVIDLISIIPGVRAIELICSFNLYVKVRDAIKLDNLLNKLTQKGIKIAIIYDESDKFCGIATLEDVMEEILEVNLGRN